MAPMRAAVSSWARQVHSGALDDMPDRIRPYAPIGKPGPLSGGLAGELRRSIRRDRAGWAGTGGRFRGRIVAPVVQARTTDQGAPAHIIRPRRVGGLLVFYWPKLGKVVGYHYVNHPGNQARPWWLKALRATYGPALRYRAVTTPFRRR